jgi:putative endonuclease
VGGPDARRALGSRGEDLVAAWYEAHGYRVLARNWRCPEGEIDLILARGGTYVFCEVKARTTEAFGLPVEAVTPRKQARLRRLAARWLAKASTAGGDVRFDVAGVLDGRLEVVEAAF